MSTNNRANVGDVVSWVFCEDNFSYFAEVNSKTNDGYYLVEICYEKYGYIQEKLDDECIKDVYTKLK